MVQDQGRVVVRPAGGWGSEHLHPDGLCSDDHPWRCPNHQTQGESSTTTLGDGDTGGRVGGGADQEALGISEEEEIASSSILSQTDDSEDQTEDVEETTMEEIPLDESWEPDASVGEILSAQTEEIGLEGLNDLADELEEEGDDIDVSFLDDALDDN